ncbi:hypothetical protein Q4S45_21435 [Massilia sp. R2A-15]|uniref:hypothetical protein n=1 Tax=Massilia sp. R2A-15 TaxID=3064278 RepID=UPI002735B2C1|nr:hypothetical protein [Massilia sp. R2A-15]WLI89227.1 hypothetical protein Q4S45_21435 [Massilia sp. R2A-15]
MTKAAPKIWMIENQLGKRNTSDFRRVALTLKLKPLIELRAHERMLAGKAAPANPVLNSTQGTGKTHDRTGQGCRRRARNRAQGRTDHRQGNARSGSADTRRRAVDQRG